MISLSDLRRYKAEGRKFSCLTCYDASMAKAMEIAEVDSILIGDSLVCRFKVVIQPCL